MLRDDLALALSPNPADRMAKRKSTSPKERSIETPKPAAAAKPKTPSPKPAAAAATPSKPVPSSATKKKVPIKSTTTTTPARRPLPATPSSGLRRGGYGTPGFAPPPPSYLRPTSASKHRASPRKDPVTNQPVDVTLCSRHGYAHTHADDHNGGGARAKRRVLPSSIDMDKIVSPVARYIRQHPVPPIMRQVRYKLKEIHQYYFFYAAQAVAQW